MAIYLFDFDGTLVDSMPTISSVMLRVLEESGVAYPDDVIKIITPLGYKNTATYFREQLGIRESDEEITNKINGYAIDAYAKEIQAKNNVLLVLLQLKERGASLNVLTASPHTMLDPCLKRLGMYDLFDNVWSCEDFGRTKADPQIYKMAAQRLGVGVEEVIFLDDNLGSATTAKSAGMTVYGVYDPSSKEFSQQMKAVADKYIEDFSQLL